MVTFPNCKINLGLRILQKREDGYHNIETVFFPLPFFDILEVISSDKTDLKNTGISAGKTEDNLCLKAYYLLKKDFPELPQIQMHLHKTIPIGAGLGGGSADAAFTLLLLNKKYDLKISQQRIFEYALKLGSDCPFFIINKPVFATGRGEKMKELDISLSDYKILIINPGIHINTKEMFQKVSPVAAKKSINEIISQPIETWKNELVNDFEEIVFLQHSQIKKIKKKLYDHNAIYASMTGTGSTVFGIFNPSYETNLPVEKGYFYKWINL
ncbi:MAG TPA: 4-(cytidine 5'-diphospho)-2-C-methyl-D-erythritol kinase [Hanamia sp.]|nr:4-(cytidine 5'-diphospho)-2-C-methyl-D-erythritol kinase [Hanamia sp.]